MSTCSSLAATVTDPDRFHAMVRPNDGKLTVTAKGAFALSYTRINLHRVWMQAAMESLPRIYEGDMTSDRRAIVFHMSPGPAMIAQGIGIGSNEIAINGVPGMGICHRLTGPTDWCSMSLSTSDWAEIGVCILGHDLPSALASKKVTPSAQALAKLKRVHAGAIYLAHNAPELIERPDAAQGLENALIEAAVECLQSPQNQKIPPSRGIMH